MRRFMKDGAMYSATAFDPRTVARDIPGLFEAVLPQLTPGVVSAFNREAMRARCDPVLAEDVAACTLQHAMLFELGFAVGEMLVTSGIVDFESCIQRATQRQRRYFDARLPDEIPDGDRQVAMKVGENLASMLMELRETRLGAIIVAPSIPGFQWIASGSGDFSINESLIEVKCSARNFSAPDYRQLTMYWLLSYARAIESDGAVWTEGVLLNPRSAKYVIFRFDDLLRIVSAGRAKTEIFGLFSSLVGTRGGI